MNCTPNLMPLNRLRNAHNMARTAERILARVTAADPDSAERQRDIGVSHFKLFQVTGQEGNSGAAHGHLRACVAALETLEADGRLPNPGDQRFLAHWRQQLTDRDAG